MPTVAVRERHERDTPIRVVDQGETRRGQRWMSDGKFPFDALPAEAARWLLSER